MSSERPQQTMADYVVMVLSPALIMALVGSLVFFLLEIFYHGEFVDRMQWILFFYVFGAVLVARIALTADISIRARLYGGILAVLVWIGLQQLVEYPKEVEVLSWGINLLLVLVVWWSTYQLTRDCTHLDETSDMTGEGLLQASGLETTGPQSKPPEQPATQAPAPSQENKKSRPLGVWVVYFSLAALPLFGLGQALIPVDEGDRRAYVFWLMIVYVGAGLGLLLTTCFLSLRRYLRQRGLQMPRAMTGTWLGVGGGLVLALLVAGALLPRPAAEYSVLTVVGVKSPKRNASRYSFKSDSPAREQERSQSGSSSDNQKASQSGDRGNPDKDSTSSNSKSSQSGQNSGGDQKSSSPSKDNSSSKSQQGNSSQSRSQQRQDSSRPQKGGQAQQQNKQGEQSSQQDQDRDGSTQSQSRRQTDLKSALASVAKMIKWALFAVLAVAALVYVARLFLYQMAPFSEWAQRLLDAWRRFWERLFAKRSSAQNEAEDEAPLHEDRGQPFADFSSPFLGGDSRRSAAELVRYTFAAVQAWARERGLERQPGETPREFTRRVGDEVPALEADLQRLAELYALAAYSKGQLPPRTADALRVLWKRLEAVAEQPLSA